MDKILSQEEISALFSNMAGDGLGLETSTEKAAPGKKIANYDFHRADRISQDQIRSLHLLHDYFGRNFSASLSAYLRAFVEVTLKNLDQIWYSEFLRMLPDPTLYSSIGMRPLDGNLAMELNPSLVFPMIDILLGGPGNAANGERNMTEIEMNIIEGVIRLALKDLREAWRPVMELDFFLEGTGTKPQMFQIVSQGETVIAIALEIRFGENVGQMNICIPSRVLKLIRNKFDQQWDVRKQKASGTETLRVLDIVKSVPVSLNVEMRNSKLFVKDFLDISGGDVIELNGRVGDPFLLCVGGIPKFRGRLMVHRGNKAFEISEKISA